MSFWNLGFYSFGAVGLLESLLLSVRGQGGDDPSGFVILTFLAMGLWGGLVGLVLGAVTYRLKHAEEWTLFIVLLALSGGYYFFWLALPWRSDLSATAAGTVLFLIYSSLLLRWRRFPSRLFAKRRLLFIVSSFCLTISFLWLYLGVSHARLRGEAAEPGLHRRNLVVVVVDTLRADRLGCYGNPKGLTPVIDELARSGVVFTNAYSQMPYTVASIGSLFTSLYPWTFGSSILDYQVREEHLTLAEILQERGYQTAAFVSGFPLKSHFSGIAQGFGHYDDNFFLLDRLLGPYDQQFYKLTPMRYAWKLLGSNQVGVQRTASEVNRAVFSWLKQKYDASRPLFLWVHYFDPHISYDPPKSFDRFYGAPYSGKIDGKVNTIRKIWNRKLGLHRRDIQRIISLYEGEIAYTDSEIGHLLRYLKRLGILENGILVLTADHGESLWEHNYPFAHGDLVYNSTMRVPLIFKGIEGIPIGRSDMVVQLVDVLPTVLAALDLPIPGNVQGENLLPWLGSPENNYFRTALGQAIGQTNPNTETETFRFFAATKRWKVIANSDNTLEVYDLESDPGETHPVKPEGVAVDIALRRLHWYMAQTATRERNTRALSQETIENLKSLGYLE